MTVAVARRSRPKQPLPQVLGPYSAGAFTTPEEFDRAEFEDGFRYELIEGVLVVSPIPLEEEASPNDLLGYFLLHYLYAHALGYNLNHTLPERIVKTGLNRRRPDRIIWAGLGRQPRRGEKPTIIVEFVSKGKRNRYRDYELKRDEYLVLGVKEYWIIDRFDRTLTVFSRNRGRTRKQVIRETDTYETPLLPGFVMPLAQLLASADKWSTAQDETSE